MFLLWQSQFSDRIIKAFYLLLLFGGKAFGSIISLAIIYLLSHQLHTVEFGEFIFFFSAGSIIGVIGQFGAHDTIVRVASTLVAGGRLRRAKYFIWQERVRSLVSSSALAIASAIIIFTVCTAVFEYKFLDSFLIGSATGAFGLSLSLLEVHSASLKVFNHQIFAIFFREAMPRIIQALVIILMIYLGALEHYTVMAIFVAANILTLAAAYLTEIRILQPDMWRFYTWHIVHRFAVERFRDAVSISKWSAEVGKLSLLAVLNQATPHAVALAVLSVFPAGVAEGVFLGMRFANIATLPLNVLNGVVGPKFARYLHRREFDLISSLYRSVMVFSFLVGLAAIALVMCSMMLADRYIFAIENEVFVVFFVYAAGRLINAAAGPTGYFMIMANKSGQLLIYRTASDVSALAFVLLLGLFTNTAIAAILPATLATILLNCLLLLRVRNTVKQGLA